MPFIHTRDNTQLFYIDAGRGRCVVFVASAWFDGHLSASPRCAEGSTVLRATGRSVNVIAQSFPYGLSALPPGSTVVHADQHERRAGNGLC